MWQFSSKDKKIFYFKIGQHFLKDNILVSRAACPAKGQTKRLGRKMLDSYVQSGMLIKECCVH